MEWVFLLLLFLLLCASSSSADALPPPPLITLTSCGAAEGAWVESNVNGSPLPQRVAAFRSIPYGAPPLGSQRWVAPSPAPCWPAGSTYDATAFKSACVQPTGLLGSEDCLFLHVYIPEVVLNGSYAGPPVPIMFYIHGGGLMAGSGNWENPLQFVAGAPLAAPVIVVVVNYRLNIFGFLAIAEGLRGNYGILDQQLALRWVQANAASFGGDPRRVTLAGQSSGGTSIFALYASPASRGLFAGAIALSGSPNISISLEAAFAQNAGIPTAIGCGGGGGSSAADTLACLRNASIVDLASATPASWNTPGLWGLPHTRGGMNFSGLPIVDGEVLTMSFPAAMAAGLVNASLMMGNMAQECDLGPDVSVKHDSDAQWAAYLNATFTGAGWPPSAAAALYEAYRVESAIDPQRAYDQLNADYGLACAFRDIALGAKSGGGAFAAPIYLFVNNWPPSAPFPSGTPDFNVQWAFHTWDFDAAWGNFPVGLTANATDFALGDYLAAAWYDLMDDAALDPARSNGWLSVEQVPGFPTSYGTYVLATPSLPPFAGSAFVENYKTDICALLVGNLSLDQRYWWCD